MGRMIGISKLYCGTVEPSDPLRYGRPGQPPPRPIERKPVVVWNCTRRCNLRCAHCYSASGSEPAPDELTGDEARAMIDDLAAFGCPALLVSGGEPLLRADVPDLIAHARAAGLRTVLSTNGTRLDATLAGKLRAIGLSYVGVSLDGASAETNDRFRGQKGAFDAALTGIRHCLAAGVKVGLRFTVTGQNAADIDGIFDLIEREGIPRVCFYHLVSAGRGGELRNELLPHERTRSVLDRILLRSRERHEAGRPLEVLTVDNHADGPYLYRKLLAENPARAADVYRLLQMNGGNGSGVSIACVSWDGKVHPDQFWRNQTVGNVRERPFSKIWSDPDQPLLRQLRNRKKHLRRRCNRCRFLDVCNGNLRARAEAAGNGIWGDDPACYLTEEEIQ
jgi:radical SAM protein with 4Fe4S-binding SPASM domain